MPFLSCFSSNIQLFGATTNANSKFTPLKRRPRSRMNTYLHSLVSFCILLISIIHNPNSPNTNILFAQAAYQNHKKFSYQNPPSSFDPYATLSIHHGATSDQIQKAYRSKAKETHPDKNPDDPLAAAEQFRQVSEAYEILSDPKKKRVYDAQFRMREEQRRQQRARERRQNEQRREKDEWEKREKKKRQVEMANKAKDLYHRVMRLSDLNQMEKMFLDSSGNYRKNYLIMFVGNKKAEKAGEEDYYFPFPFAVDGGEFGDADFIQVAKVRFNTETELTKTFNIPPNKSTPQFIFTKQNDPHHKFHTFQPTRNSTPNTHIQLTNWVKSLLALQNILIINHHTLPIDVHILRDKTTIFYHQNLKSGYQLSLTTGSKLRPGDRIIAYDSRIDSLPGSMRILEKLSDATNVYLLEEVVMKDDVAYVVESRRCVDLSTQCGDWMMSSTPGNGGKKQCDLIPEFMHHVCPLSCGVCSETFFSSITYYIFHYPVHRLPMVIRPVVREGRIFVEDTRNIILLRKNAAAAFFVVGLLVAFNIVLFQTLTTEKTRIHANRTNGYGRSEVSQHQMSQTMNDSLSGLIFAFDISMIIFTGSLVALTKWILSTPARKIPSWLKGFHGDFSRVAKDSDIFWVFLAVGVVASIYTKAFVGTISEKKMDVSNFAMFVAILLSISSCVLGVLSHMMTLDVSRVVRWKHLWKFRKNAAFTITALGFAGGLGVISFKRLIKNAHNGALLPFLLFNTIVLGAVGALASWDHHFMQLRKNAAVAFVILGVFAGKLVEIGIERFLVRTATKEKLKKD
mmetsp:Transcript_33637/g.64570  ORF Transcript_33637/g.64570 Transcript_33637/m.64570 type:complete len:795 (-) Transcript_33637:160-2544(-)